MCIGLETILTEEPNGDYACWAERRERNVMLHASPVEIGKTLKAELYEKLPGIVFTSATLSSGGSLDYFKSRLGLDDDSNGTERILDSPFDYARQTMLFIPQSVPEPNAPGFTEAVSEVIQQILLRTLGRAFVQALSKDLTVGFGQNSNIQNAQNASIGPGSDQSAQTLLQRENSHRYLE